VIVLKIFPDSEHYADLRIEAFNVERREIGLRIEDEPVSPGRQWFFKEEKRFNSSFFVRPGVSELFPALITFLTFKIDSYAIRRLAAGRVKNVG